MLRVSPDCQRTQPRASLGVARPARRPGTRSRVRMALQRRRSRGLWPGIDAALLADPRPLTILNGRGSTIPCVPAQAARLNAAAVSGTQSSDSMRWPDSPCARQPRRSAPRGEWVHAITRLTSSHLTRPTSTAIFGVGREEPTVGPSSMLSSTKVQPAIPLRSTPGRA